MSVRKIRKLKPVAKVHKMREAVILGAMGGKKGGKARANALSAKERSRIASLGGKTKAGKNNSRTRRTKQGGGKSA
jgi:hypothetical protein